MRTLDEYNLDNAGRFYAAEFLRATNFSRNPATPTLAIGGKGWMMNNLVNCHYKDDFDYLYEKVRANLGKEPLKDFETEFGKIQKPRSEKVFAKLLADKLAIDPDGNHIPGKIGTSIVDGRLIGRHTIEVEHPDSIRHRKRLGLDKSPENRELIQIEAKRVWNVYAGENEERIANSGVADPLPRGTPGMPVGALTTRIGNAAAQDACDAVVDLLDEGSVGAVLQGRTTPRPSQVDDVVTGTNLFTVTYQTVAFQAAGDAAPGGIASETASIVDDASADNGGTLLYCRISSSNSTDTPLNDHLEGEAGTSGADFNFNTLAIVGGSTVSLTSHDVTMPEA